jgi:hypothetical protein
MSEESPLSIKCRHGNRPAAVVCGHMLLTTDRVLGFVENGSDPNDLQAWCDECEQFFLRDQALTDEFEKFNDRKIVCDLCYAEMRARHSKPQQA